MLLSESTAGLVRILNQSDKHTQIFVRHKLPRQFRLWPGMAYDKELINGIQKNFRDN